METKIRKKILLIDDEPEVTMVIRSRLEAADYDVDVAHSGQEGLRKFNNYHPDLVVVDIMMEDLTGYEVCTHIKEIDRHCPVILLTSRVKGIDESLGFLSKADAYIRKPRSSQLLLPEVKRLLEKRDELQS